MSNDAVKSNVSPHLPALVLRRETLRSLEWEGECYTDSGDGETDPLTTYEPFCPPTLLNPRNGRSY